MEWLEGEDLRQLLQRQRLEVLDALAMLRPLARALAHAHEHGIRHRDIKPANIFLVEGRVDRPKLLDFGIAHIDARTGLTQPGLLVGTPGYMAPEQARAGEEIGPAADIFALGCVAFEALTGQPAFRGDTLLSLLAKLVFDDAPRLRDVSPELPEALEGLIARMLHKDLSGRIADGTALAAALERLEAAPPDAPAEGESSAIGRHERRVASIVLIGTSERLTPRIQAELTTATLTSGPDLQRDLAEIAASASARVEQLADGSLALWISDGGLPKDQATTAARVALALRARLPGRPIALTTGLVDTAGRSLGAAFDRAAWRLHRSSNTPREGVLPIVQDEVTAALLDARFDWSEGPEGPELWTERQEVDPTRTLLGRSTPFVGREREFRTLMDAFTGCVDDEEAAVFLLAGAPGTGKSRVAHEFVLAARKRRSQLNVWAAHGDPIQASASGGLVAQALRGALGVLAEDPLQTRRRRVRESLMGVVPAADEPRLAAFLGELTGAGDPSNMAYRAALQDPPLMAAQIREAFVDLVRHMTRDAPLVLLLEDLQWSDPTSLALVEAALRGASDRPFFVLAVARPDVHERFPRLWQGLGAQELELRPLSARASQQLVRATLGEDLDPAVMTQLVERAEGNAFFLEELIRAAAGDRSAALPETVIATVRARLETLDAELRRVLRAASVFGDACWSRGVANLLGRTRDTGEIRADLLRLSEAELLARRPHSRFSGTDEFAFRHALHREGAYAMLTDEDRALGHYLAGEWLASTGEAEPTILAEHFERAGRGDLASQHLLAAAERAHLSSDSETTLALARRGLACEGVAPERRAVFLGLVADVLGWRGEALDAAPIAAEAMALAPVGGPTWVRAAIPRLIACMLRGDLAGVQELADAAAAVPPDEANAGLLARPLLIAINALDSAGRLADAGRLEARVGELAARFSADDLLSPAWVAISRASRAASVEDDPWSGRREALRAADLFAAVDHRRGALNAAALIGVNLWHLGASDGAIRVLRELVADHREIGVLAAYPLFALSLAYLDHGLVARAVAVASALVTSGQERGILVDEGRGLLALACCRLAAGEVDPAITAAARASELLAVVPFELPGALAVLAAAALAARDLETAARASAEAQRRLDAMGACGFFFAGRVRLVRAEVLRALGDEEGARAALSSACERLRRLAALVPDSAYRASILSGRPEHARTLALAAS